jgi:iron complex outermembrane recepter protein
MIFEQGEKMHPRKFKLFVQLLVLLLVLVLNSTFLVGQTKQLLTWREDLASIQAAPASEIGAQRDAVLQIRTGVEFWLRLHPNTAIKLAAAPTQPWNSEQLLQQVSLLQETVESIIKEDPGQSFELGVTEISVTAETSPLSPITDSVDRGALADYHLTNVAQSFQFLPGVTVDHKSARNQAGIMIRGFDTRQIGIYLDGIPIYVPYDGYADIGRFLTNDLSQIEVAKGYSSPLLGPNGLGGAVNLVSRQPDRKLEGDISMGAGSGQMIESGVHIGSRWNQFFFRGGMDWLETDYFPMSGGFTLNSVQPNYNRVNSYARDVRYSGRAGWTPKNQDQYVFTYTNQKADYAAPPYSGNDTKNNKVRYWQWPYWNRESYYFNSNTGLGESSSIKFRAFYDKYPNSLNQYTNGAYSALSSTSKYDDFSAGASAEFANRTFSRHSLGASFFFKDDTHKETGASYSSAGVPTYQPWRTQRDQQFSIGFQDSITISTKIRATAGFSVDYLNAVKAQNLETTTVGKPPTTTYGIAPFPCNGVPNDSFSTCLLDSWTFNPLASISYSVANSGTLFFTFAAKSHFPTLKDRYSYKNGQAIPNPNIQPEHSNNFNLGYSHVFAFNTMMQLDLYRNDVYDAIQNATIPAQFPNQCPTMPIGICQQSVNVGKEVHQGAEFTIRSTPVSLLTFDANYAFLNRTISGPPNMQGVYPTGTPKHRVIGTAAVRLPRKIQLLATARYESGTITTNDSGLIIPASKFATADFGGIVPLYSGLDLRAGVKNLFDRNYYYQEGFPEAGRNWYMNLRYRF